MLGHGDRTVFQVAVHKLQKFACGLHRASAPPSPSRRDTESLSLLPYVCLQTRLEPLALRGGGIMIAEKQICQVFRDP